MPAVLRLIKNSVLRASRFFGYEIVPLREMKERDFALHLRKHAVSTAEELLA
jgi:hypothetical protein